MNDLPPPPAAAWRCRTHGGPGRSRVRFTLSDLPGLTSWPPHCGAAVLAAAAALAALGLGYQGGHLEVSSRGPAAEAAEHLAARRAVESAVRGGCGTARVAVPERAMHRTRTD